MSSDRFRLALLLLMIAISSFAVWSISHRTTYTINAQGVVLNQATGRVCFPGDGTYAYCYNQH